uniref:Vps16_N domain-containing protein n=2 Tax=Macrostomum lignano TaxID=282301 RepID=A0A1I8G4S9_9PLAT
RSLCQKHFVWHIGQCGSGGGGNSSSSVQQLRSLLTEVQTECSQLALQAAGSGQSLIVNPTDQQLVVTCAQQLLALLGSNCPLKLSSTGGGPGGVKELLGAGCIRRKDWQSIRQSVYQCHSDPYDVVLVRHTQVLYYCPSAGCSSLRRNRPDHSWRRLPRTLLYCSHDNGEVELIACGVVTATNSSNSSNLSFSPLTRVQLRHRQRLALHYQERGELLLLANWHQSRVHVCNLALECVHLITGLLHPSGLCVDPLRALLYVTNSIVGNVDVYHCDTYRYFYTLRHEEFHDLHSVCCHGNRLFVSDTVANCIFAFSTSDLSRVVQRYRLNCPGFICVDWEGCLYVAYGAS